MSSNSWTSMRHNDCSASSSSSEMSSERRPWLTRTVGQKPDTLLTRSSRFCQHIIQSTISTNSTITDNEFYFSPGWKSTANYPTVDRKLDYRTVLLSKWNSNFLRYITLLWFTTNVFQITALFLLITVNFIYTYHSELTPTKEKNKSTLLTFMSLLFVFCLLHTRPQYCRWF